MIALLGALVAAIGAHLLYTSLALGWTGFRLGPRRRVLPSRHRFAFDEWLVQAGLADVGRREFAGVLMTLAVVGIIAGAFLFGSVLPAIACGAFAMSFPVASFAGSRVRRTLSPSVPRASWLHARRGGQQSRRRLTG